MTCLPIRISVFRFTLRACVLASAALLIAPAVGSAQEMQYPLAVAAADDGVVYIGDLNLPGVWKVADGKRTLLFEGSKKFRTPLNRVRCLGFDADGNLLAGDSSTRDVYRFDEQNQPQPLLKGENAGIGIPMDIVATKEGDLLVSDLEIHRIWKIKKEGGAAEEFAAVPAPSGLFLDDQNRLWVVSREANSLYRVSADGKPEVVVKGRAFEFPHNVVVDKEGTAYVSDGYARAIWKIAEGQAPEKWVEHEEFKNPVDICWRGENLLVVDPRAVAVFEITPDAKVSKLLIE